MLINVFRILERQERHEVGVVHDVGFGGALHQVALSRVGRDDVADGVGHAAFQRQRDSGKRMAQRLSALALPALAVRAQFVFQQLAHIRQNGARDHRVHVDGQGASHELLHGLGALARDVHHAALVLHESDGAIGHQQREGNAIQVVRLQRAALQRLDPGLR